MKDSTFRTAQRNTREAASFQDLEATELYCPNCRRAVPVRKFLLLVLPEGDKYEYRCGTCGAIVGDKTERAGRFQA